MPLEKKERTRKTERKGKDWSRLRKEGKINK